MPTIYTLTADQFMLLVWDLVLYARHSDAVNCDQYGDVQELFRTVWPLPYELPFLVGHGL